MAEAILLAPPGPAFHDLVFRDQLAVPLDEQAQQIERARAERDRGGHTPLT
jgi:hypothetical protein